MKERLIAKVLGTFCGLFVIYAALRTSTGTNTLVYLIIYTPPMVYFLYTLWFKKVWYDEKEHNKK